LGQFWVNPETTSFIIDNFIGRYLMKTVKTIISILMLGCLLGCQQLKLDNYTSDRSMKTSDSATTNIVTNSNLAEVTSPKIIKELDRELEQYNPQVKIIAPQTEKTLNQTDAVIKLAVEDLPIFQDDRLHLGNHLNLIVDNEPFQAIYSLDEPIIIKNLAPGTHTLRVFAVSPWGESFKNEGAYAQTTFNVLTETNANRPNADLPLLTYNSPNGTYGAEPVLLDFYLNNPNLASVKNNPERQKLLVKATINGTSLIIEDWQPYYLTGFEPGENWIQLELIDESGNTIENAFNNTARVFIYNPQQQDNLAQLVTNKISFDDAQSIVKQSYYIQPSETPEIIDFEDIKENTEPKIIPSKELEPNLEQLPEADSVTTHQENKPEKLEITTPQTERISAKESTPNKPNNSQIVVLNKVDEVSNPKTEAAAKNPDTTVKTKTDSDSLAVSDSKNDSQTSTKLEPQPSASKIVITESNSSQDSKETVAEIIIPQSESIEIVKSDDVAIAVPSPKIPFPEVKTEAPVWWRKFLVGLRQKLQGLVELLPSEV
jgi:hypothetical protein